MLWFMYTKWADILVFSYIGCSYVLQGRKNKITKATSFRISKAAGRALGFAYCTVLKSEHLKEAGLWSAGK